jgi:alpha-glucosidase (family GH31 glycosyl hydrolase)
MIKHVPTGLGHPYRTEPFERSPHFPVVDEKVTLRVCVLPGESSVTLHFVEDGAEQRYEMKNDGSALARDLGEYGLPDKEIFSNTHLEDAAARSGEYGHWDSWSAEVTLGSKEVTYFFSTQKEKSAEYSLLPSQWVPLNLVDSEIPIVGEEWLVDMRGVAHKVRFAIGINEGDRVIGFGERFHSIVQNGELVDAIVYEEYKGQGHRTYLPTPFAMIIGSNFAFHLQTTKNSRFDVAQKSPNKIYVEVDWDDLPSVLTVKKYAGKPAEMLYSHLQEVGLPEAPPEWSYELWLSSNEWNTQERVERELESARAIGIHDGIVVIEAWSDESTFTVFRDAQYTPTKGEIGLSASDISYPADGAWPDPAAMISKMHDDGFKLILWQIPVIKERGESGSQAEANWDYAIAHNHVVKDENSDPYRVRGFWFRDGLLPDLTDAQTRKWWTEQRRYLVTDLGVDGFKTDGGEHAWGQGLQYKDGETGIDKNNLFAKFYSQAFHELFQSTGREGITFSRAGFTGSQKYPTFWAGDENSTWKAFKASINAGLTASASGFFFWGWDIGGFSGEIPTAELYLRSSAMSIFTPIMQIHSEFNHHQVPSNDRTPWNIAERYDDPSIAELFSDFYSLRKKLIPYLVREGKEAISSGRPLMAGLFFDYEDDDEIWRAPHQFMCGRSILVAPISDPGVTKAKVYLPAGSWRDFWSDEPYEGGRWIEVDAPLHQIPAFIKEGASIY